MKPKIKTLKSLLCCTKAGLSHFCSNVPGRVGLLEWGYCLLGKLFTHCNLQELSGTTMAGPSIHQ